MNESNHLHLIVAIKKKIKKYPFLSIIKCAFFERFINLLHPSMSYERFYSSHSSSNTCAHHYRWTIYRNHSLSKDDNHSCSNHPCLLSYNQLMFTLYSLRTYKFHRRRANQSRHYLTNSEGRDLRLSNSLISLWHFLDWSSIALIAICVKQNPKIDSRVSVQNGIGQETWYVRFEQLMKIQNTSFQNSIQVKNYELENLPESTRGNAFTSFVSM